MGDLVRGLDRDEFESHILVLQFVGRFGQGLTDVATLHQAPRMSRLSLVRPAALASTIREVAPDVVHAHSGVWYKAALAARMSGVRRVIYTEHGRRMPDPWHARAMDHLASRRTDVAVGVSTNVGNALENIVAGGCSVRVILNGVDTSVFRRTPDTGHLRAELGVGPETPILGSIGRLEPIKGYDVMIEAFAQFVLREGPARAARLVIAGDGSTRDALRRRIAELGIEQRVHLLGWRDDTMRILSALQLFTMSSRSEGTSISLLEAMSSGICPVVTNVGGNSAVLGPELAHRLVPSEQPAALASAWAEALGDARRRDEDSRTARERVLSSHSASAMVRAYEAVYRSG